VPAGVVLPLIFAELIFARLVEIAGQAYMAFEQLRQTALLLLALSVSRMLAAAGLMLFYRHPSASAWANLYLVSTAIPAVWAVAHVNRHLGRPLLRYSLQGRDLLQGFYFSISLSAQTIYNDIDKTMLARLSGLTPAGLYGAAYRLIDVATSPLGALTASTYSRFFQHGDKGLAPAVQFARRLLPMTLLYGTGCSAALILAAPLMQPILGRQYADSITAVRWLAPIVLLRCIHYIGADALTGADHQGVRSGIQVTVAAANVVLNLYLLPRYSWQGAVAASLACDALLVVLIWGGIAALQSTVGRRVAGVTRQRLAASDSPTAAATGVPL
jgi:O-antigen/teichoic acid export membrane protein